MSLYIFFIIPEYFYNFLTKCWIIKMTYLFAYPWDNFTLLHSEDLLQDDVSRQYWRQRRLTKDWITSSVFRSNDSAFFDSADECTSKFIALCSIPFSTFFFSCALHCFTTVLAVTKLMLFGKFSLRLLLRRHRVHQTKKLRNERHLQLCEKG